MHSLIALFWQKKFISFGATHIAALEEDHLHMLHVGNALAGTRLRITRAGTDPLYAYTINRAVGQAIADKMIEGYTKDAQPHVDAFERDGPGALLDRERSVSFKRSDISDVRVLDKQGMLDPAAGAAPAKHSGLIAFKADGKNWRLVLREMERAGTEAFAELLRDPKAELAAA